MVKFEKSGLLNFENEELNNKVTELYKLTDGEKKLGFATINDDENNPIYVYVKKEYRGNRIRENII